jgi:hypothetical protein
MLIQSAVEKALKRFGLQAALKRPVSAFQVVAAVAQVAAVFQVAAVVQAAVVVQAAAAMVADVN